MRASGGWMVVWALGLGLSASAADRAPGNSDLTLRHHAHGKLGVLTKMADIDGDGVDDLLVSAPYADTTEPQAGEVHIWFGPVSADTLASPMAADSDIVLSCDVDGESFGVHLATGDLNGDGHVDAVVAVKDGKVVEKNAGAVYIFMGPLTEDRTTDDADTVLYGDHRFNFLGSGVVLADFDEDGDDELVLGAYGDDTCGPALDCGAVYLVKGHPTDFPVGVHSVRDVADRTITGAPGSQFGYSLAVLDGHRPGARAKLAIGAPTHDYANGRVVLYLNDGSSPALPDSGFAQEVADALLDGTRADSFFGNALDVAPGLALGSVGDDLLVNASNTGTTFLFRGLDLAAGGRIDDVDGWAELVGTAASTPSGWMRSAVGHFDRDGHTDLAIGDYQAYSFGSTSMSKRYGAVYVHQGPVAAGTIDLEADAAWQFEGDFDNTWFGYSVSSGDVNDDGRDDLLIGQPYSQGQNGRAHLFYGPYDALVGESPLAEADARFWGAATSDLFGYQMRGVGDVDCDGVPDVAVSAPFSGEGSVRAGSVHIYSGPDGGDSAMGWHGGELGALEAHAVLTGESHLDYFGATVIGAGDVDGDGCDDLLVAAPFEDGGGVEAGAVYLYLGGDALRSGRASAVAQHVFRGSAGERLGLGMAALGDISGDGLADFALGAPFATPALDAREAPIGAGRVDIWYGRDGDRDWFRDTCSVVGTSPYGALGLSLAGGLDLDLDGIDDLAVGVPGDDLAGPHAGAVYVFSDARCAQHGGQRLPRAASHRFLGAEQERLGTSMAAAHLEGGDALAVSGPAWGGHSGRVHLIPAGGAMRDGPAPAGGVAICQEGDFALGYTLDAGDVTGDGVDDLWLGAPMAGGAGLEARGSSLLFDGAALEANMGGDVCVRLDQAVFAVHGGAQDARVGTSAFLLGDLNQDGEQDLGVGVQWQATSAGWATGAAHVVLSSHVP